MDSECTLRREQRGQRSQVTPCSFPHPRACKGVHTGRRGPHLGAPASPSHVSSASPQECWLHWLSVESAWVIHPFWPRIDSPIRPRGPTWVPPEPNVSIRSRTGKSLRSRTWVGALRWTTETRHRGIPPQPCLAHPLSSVEMPQLRPRGDSKGAQTAVSRLYC